MADSRGPGRGPQVRSGPMITGVALAGAGITLTVAGFAVGTTHLLAATRRWMRELEVPPSEMARLRWTQAKAAAVAGSNAWQQVQPPAAPRPRATVLRA
jgi:hypothetical protein